MGCGLRRTLRGIIFVMIPIQRILGDVPPDVHQVVFIADDVFVIIALPDGTPGIVTQGINAFGHDRFEIARILHRSDRRQVP